MRQTLRSQGNAGISPSIELITRPAPVSLKSSHSLQRWSGSTINGHDDDNKAPSLDVVSLDLSLTDPASIPPASCLLFQMPAEINYEIISHLSYPDARQLKNTCRFFRMYFTPDYMASSKEQWKTILLDLDIAGEFEADGRLPCYTCVRLRPKACFPTASPRGVTIPRLADRACIECSWRNKGKGEAIWIESKAWTRCQWCGRAKKAYRYTEQSFRPALCGYCGRARRLAYIWPAVLLHMAELAVTFCVIVWTSWGSVEGWLVGANDKDWDKGSVVRVLVIIPLIQLFLSMFYQLIWHHATDPNAYTGMVVVNFWFSIMAWIWALSEPASISKDDPRAYQLCMFVMVAGISAILLSFIRLMCLTCFRTCCRNKMPF